MKLDRCIAGNQGLGKYAILKLRTLKEVRGRVDSKAWNRVADAISVLEDEGILDWGLQGTESEFFLIRLKDEFALPALKAYAAAAEDHDFEYATEVRDMAQRSGGYSPFCKKPD